MKKILLPILIILVFCVTGVKAATTSPTSTNPACSPAQVKPAKQDTSLATTFSIAPEIVAVGQLATFQVMSQGINNTLVRIDIPEGMELVDYNPKTIGTTNIKSQTKAVEWQVGGGKIPTDAYSIILKPSKWTKNNWKEVSYAASSDLGTGYGANYYFSYYDKIQPEISLDEKNQAPQTSKEVVRKVTVKAVPDVKVNLLTDKGALGATISQSSGQKISQTANANGEITAFLFAKEGDKVNLTASSADSCQNSSVSQSFKIGQSNIAKTFTDNSWLWWLAGGIILVLLLVLIIWLVRKKHAENVQGNSPENTGEISDNLPPTNLPKE